MRLLAAAFICILGASLDSVANATTFDSRFPTAVEVAVDNAEGLDYRRRTWGPLGNLKLRPDASDFLQSTTIECFRKATGERVLCHTILPGNRSEHLEQMIYWTTVKPLPWVREPIETPARNYPAQCLQDAVGEPAIVCPKGVANKNIHN